MGRRSARASMVIVIAAIVGSAALIPAAESDAAPLRRTGHTDMAWSVTDRAGTHPPDVFGGGGSRQWAGPDRIWNQPGFTGAYTITVAGQDVAAYCGDFHNARSPDHASQWQPDRSVFQGSDKALTKLSYVQWRWGATTDSDIGAALNLYTHFLGSPGDRSNSSGVPVPDINDNDVLDEIVTTLHPHESVGPIMVIMDRAAENWSAAFGHLPANVQLGIELSRAAGVLALRSTATGLALPTGSFELQRTGGSTTAITSGLAVALRDVTNHSQHTLTAGQPQHTALADASDVTVSSQISHTSPPVAGHLSDAIEITGLVDGATAHVEVQLFDLTADPTASGLPLAAEVRDGLTTGVTEGFARFTVTTDVAGHTLGYRHRLLATSDGAAPGEWSELGIESETGTADPLRAEVHLRKLISSASHPEWVNAQRDASWSHEPGAAPADPLDGSYDGRGPLPNDGTPIYPSGDLISFRYELWSDSSSTGAVAWDDAPDSVVIDDAGTPESTDDFAPTYVGGDDGDGRLEHGETWIYEAIEQRTATAGETYTNLASVPQGAIVDPSTGRDDGASTTPRQDPAGYVVPCLSTSAADESDGDQSLAHDGGVIVDTLTYCNLVPGIEYVADATVVEQATGEAARHSGSTIFTPTASAGVVEVEIVVMPDPDDSAIEPGRFVVFETVSIAATGRVVVNHAALDDAAQTFVVLAAPPPPTTVRPPPPAAPTTSSTLPTTDPPTKADPPGTTLPAPSPGTTPTTPPATTPGKEIPRAGDSNGKVLADVGSVVFVIGVVLLCVAWWRHPDEDVRPSLES